MIPLEVTCTVSESIQTIDMVTCTVSESAQMIDMLVDMQIINNATDPYEGEYVVVPSTREQMLHTNGKRMEDDVTVREIPYYEVSNQSGITVFIADNIND